MPMDEWEIRPEDLTPVQRDVADLIGFENYLKLIDAMYAYAQLEAGNGAVQSVSIGSVSENRAAVPAPDTSPAARAAEYYRCVQLYATIYRGC